MTSEKEKANLDLALFGNSFIEIKDGKRHHIPIENINPYIFSGLFVGNTACRMSIDMRIKSIGTPKWNPKPGPQADFMSGDDSDNALHPAHHYVGVTVP